MAGHEQAKGKSVLFSDQQALAVCKPEASSSTGSNTTSSSDDASLEGVERVVLQKILQLRQALKETK